MHSKSNEFGESKMTYNLEWKDYHLYSLRFLIFVVLAFLDTLLLVCI
jgi:hypothetical protein